MAIKDLYPEYDNGTGQFWEVNLDWAYYTQRGISHQTAEMASNDEEHGANCYLTEADFLASLIGLALTRII